MRSFNTIYKNMPTLLQFCEENNIINSKKILLQIFSGLFDEHYSKNLINSIKSFLPDINIILTLTQGEILNENVHTQSILLNFSIFDSTDISIFISDNVDEKQIAKELSFHVNSLQCPKVGICFTSKIDFNADDFIDEINLNNENLIISGGLSFDNNFQIKPFIFVNEKIYFNSTAVVLLSSFDLVVNTSYSFGYEQIGKKLSLTKASKNTIYSIDDTLACEIYTKYLGDEIVKNLPLSAAQFPILFTKNKTKIAKTIISKNDDNSLNINGNINTSEELYLAYGSAEKILQDRCYVYEKHTNTPIECVYIYSSITRKQILNDISLEFEMFSKVAPLCGFLSSGEFYTKTKNKKRFFFNQSMCVLTLSENKYQTKTLKQISQQEPNKTTQALTTFIKATTQHLQNSFEKTQKYVSLVNENVLMLFVDKKGKITDASKAFCILSEYNLNELIGNLFHMLIPNDTLTNTLRQTQKHVKLNQPYQCEATIITKSKQIKHIQVTISINLVQHDMDYMVIGQDITATKIIKKLSITDGLTNIFNRRYFNDIFPQFIKNSYEKNELLNFMLLDIDFFKQYNDTYGHVKGDEVLIKIATCIKNDLKRGNDYCFRLGGEEFGIIFEAKSNIQAIHFAQKIRTKIQNLKILHKNSTISKYVTLSIGLVSTHVKQTTTQSELYQKADAKLYEAKNTGRNKISY